MKQSTQNYLKTIFSLGLASGKTVVKAGDISKKLGVSAPAVTDMIKKLESKNFVENIPYKGVTLTPAGIEIGRNMLRHHRLWETFLFKEIGLNWDEVHDEAEQLEHACSDTLLNKIEEKMGFPQFDPHGNPIPDRHGNIPQVDEAVMLSELQAGDSGRLIRVVDLSEQYLRYLDDVGLNLNSPIQVLEKMDFDDSMVLSIPSNASVSISSQVAQHLLIVKDK